MLLILRCPIQNPLLPFKLGLDQESMLSNVLQLSGVQLLRKKHVTVVTGALLDMKYIKAVQRQRELIRGSQV